METDASSSNTSPTCQICTEDATKVNLTTLPCSHSMCFDCLFELKKRVCPFCRKPIVKDEKLMGRQSFDYDPGENLDDEYEIPSDSEQIIREVLAFHSLAEPERAPFGTGDPPFTVISERELNQRVHYNSITAMPEYADRSFEELRLEDYMGNSEENLSITTSDNLRRVMDMSDALETMLFNTTS